MYRFRYYYKNGKNSYQNIDEFDSEIKQITHNNHFNTSLDKKELHTFLELAMKEYEKNFNDIYRIDIIDDTDKILDYIDKSECLVDGKKDICYMIVVYIDLSITIKMALPKLVAVMGQNQN